MATVERGRTWSVQLQDRRCHGVVRAVNDRFPFAHRPRRRTLAIVGESGSGKSQTVLCHHGACWLQERFAPQGQYVKFDGTEILIASVTGGTEPGPLGATDRHGVSRPDDVSLNPYMRVVRSDDRSAGTAPQGHVQIGRSGRMCADAERGAHTRCQGAHPPVSARIFRRHAAARDDRHGASVSAGPVDCR